MPTVADRNNQE